MSAPVPSFLRDFVEGWRAEASAFGVDFEVERRGERLFGVFARSGLTRTLPLPERSVKSAGRSDRAQARTICRALTGSDRRHGMEVELTNVTKLETPTLTTEQRRKVMAVLAGSYDFDGQRYLPGEDDTTVGKASGVPWGLIQRYREENGLPADDPAVAGFHREIAPVQKRLADAEAMQAELAKEIKTCRAELDSAVRDTLAKLQRKAG